jgi:hypothetical protein
MINQETVGVFSYYRFVRLVLQQQILQLRKTLRIPEYKVHYKGRKNSHLYESSKNPSNSEP